MWPPSNASVISLCHFEYWFPIRFPLNLYRSNFVLAPTMVGPIYQIFCIVIHVKNNNTSRRCEWAFGRQSDWGSLHFLLCSPKSRTSASSLWRKTLSLLSTFYSQHERCNYRNLLKKWWTKERTKLRWIESYLYSFPMVPWHLQFHFQNFWDGLSPISEFVIGKSN